MLVSSAVPASLDSIHPTFQMLQDGLAREEVSSILSHVRWGLTQREREEIVEQMCSVLPKRLSEKGEDWLFVLGEVNGCRDADLRWMLWGAILDRAPRPPKSGWSFPCFCSTKPIFGEFLRDILYRLSPHLSEMTPFYGGLALEKLLERINDCPNHALRRELWNGILSFLPSQWEGHERWFQLQGISNLFSSLKFGIDHCKDSALKRELWFDIVNRLPNPLRNHSAVLHVIQGLHCSLKHGSPLHKELSEVIMNRLPQPLSGEDVDWMKVVLRMVPHSEKTCQVFVDHLPNPLNERDARLVHAMLDKFSRQGLLYDSHPWVAILSRLPQSLNRDSEGLGETILKYARGDAYMSSGRSSNFLNWNNVKKEVRSRQTESY